MTGTDGEQTRTTKLTVLGGLGAALIAAAATVGAAFVGSDPPPPAQNPAPVTASATATFTRPEPGTTISPGSDVLLEISISGLPAGHVIWVLARPDVGSGEYFKGSGAPVAQRDGVARSLVRQVGDESDRGYSYTFTAVEADAACDAAIAREVRSFTRLPDSCREIREHRLPVR